MMNRWSQMRRYEPGDFVRYKLKNELGLVGEVTPWGARCWYHLGGTKALTSFDDIELLSLTMVKKRQFSNNYAKQSLMTRRARLLRGEDVSDLIDI